METKKAGRPLIDVVKLCYEANVPLMVVGHHGVGKSLLLAQAAHELKIGCIVRDLSLMEATDLTGLPKAKRSTTSYLPPDFLPRSGGGLLILEELNRAERHVRAPALQLLSARTLNDYSLPPRWLPVAAVNPFDGEYEVDTLDPALLSRFAQVMVVPDRNEWLAWARLNAIHPAVIAYVESDGSVFDKPESNPRSWTHVSALMWAAEKSDATAATRRAAIVGKVGDARGNAFLATLKRTAHPLTAEDVLRSYPKHRDDVRRWVTEGRLDLVKATLQAIYLHVQPETDYRALRKNRRQWENLGGFFDDLPGDLLADAKKMFSSRGYELPSCSKKEHVHAA